MTKTEQVRITTWRSKVLQHAAAIGNVARTCRRFGMSRKSFYKWRRRFLEHGDTGLCDRPRAPRHSPRATAEDVISKTLYLRQHYHFGAGRIADYLKRFHPLTIARSTVHRILTRRGLQRLPANQSIARKASGGNGTKSRSPGIGCRWTSSSSSASRARDDGSTSSPPLMTAPGCAS